jgi:hypothetical protein
LIIVRPQTRVSTGIRQPAGTCQGAPELLEYLNTARHQFGTARYLTAGSRLLDGTGESA